MDERTLVIGTGDGSLQFLDDGSELLSPFAEVRFGNAILEDMKTARGGQLLALRFRGETAIRFLDVRLLRECLSSYDLDW